MPGPDYRLVIRRLPGARPELEITDLRRLLKGLLRWYRFKCLNIEAVPSADPGAAAADGPQHQQKEESHRG